MKNPYPGPDYNRILALVVAGPILAVAVAALFYWMLK
jgi:hypothetical protein